MTTSAPLPLNDDTDFGLCFACGPRNPAGLRLTFRAAGGVIETAYTAAVEHQGFPGYLHGGVISALLDEVMSRVPVLEGRWGMSAKLEVRFRRPVRLGDALVATGWREGGRGGIMRTAGRVALADGTVAAEAAGAYALLPAEELAAMAAAYPGLAAAWRVG